MELLDLFGSLLGLPTKFGGSREWSKVQRRPWVTPIDYLEGGEPSGLAWCSIERKLHMGNKLIPPLDILPHKHPKQGTQGSVSHIHLAVGLGMASGAKLEMSPHLSPQGNSKVA